jgi:N-acyl-D-aspartate/D-glutamate deacylase
MLDYLITGGTVVDGTGAPGARADVGIRDGRIVAIGEVDEPATTMLDATDLVVAPGFVDPHTHYDAQILWDPAASPSSVHGVTSIIGGNCGFTLAPLKDEDADYTLEMLSRVEGMPLGALKLGVKKTWESFGEYLDTIEGNTAVNAGFLVGHCALRRYVMGESSTGNEATAEQIDAMVALLHESLAAGGLGLSTTRSHTHSDGEGEAVSSRWASEEEVIALCRATGEHVGTTLEAITHGCLDKFDDGEIDLFARMSATARRPLNWNVLTVDSKVPERVTRQLEASTRAEEVGGRVVALTMPVQVPMNMNFGSFCALFLLPGWNEVLTLPMPERLEKLRDPATRTLMDERAHSPEAGVVGRLSNWKNYVIGDTFSEANEGLKGRIVRDIAAERGMSPFDTLLDIVLNDDLHTILWPMATDGDDASWQLRAELWNDKRAMLGGSDAGAHLDRMCGAPYTTRFLGDMIRGRRLVSLERAVQMLTDTPARYFGLRDRGQVREGWIADLVVFDPARIGSDQATLVDDLPGGNARLTAGSQGVVRVLVNGVETVVDGVSTGTRPGTVLRSTRDIDTVVTG